jgi:MFS family permease
METRPTRVHWAVALAALVGGIAGSFVAPSMDSLGVSTEGSLPLLAGGAAIYAASLIGALLGATVGAVTAFAIGRKRRQGVAAIAGSVAGIAIGVAVGYFSEGLAQAWVNAFSGNPLEGALVGGAIAGGFAGVAAAAILRVFRNLGTLVGREGSFTALSGSVLGLLAGMGGASIGATLAQSVSECPNGYYVNPYTPSSCVPGILQGSLLFGLWAGAITGAVGALVAASALSRLVGAVELSSAEN